MEDSIKFAVLFGGEIRQTVVVVQLVRTPDCGSGGRRFESGLPPLIIKQLRKFVAAFLFSACILEIHSTSMGSMPRDYYELRERDIR